MLVPQAALALRLMDLVLALLLVEVLALHSAAEVLLWELYVEVLPLAPRQFPTTRIAVQHGVAVVQQMVVKVVRVVELLVVVAMVIVDYRYIVKGETAQPAAVTAWRV